MAQLAKKYDLCIVIRRSTPERGGNAVHYGSDGDVYAQKCVEATLKEALAERQRLSDAEPRSHAAFLTMKYRDDRVAPGLEKHAVIYGGE